MTRICLCGRLAQRTRCPECERAHWQRIDARRGTPAQRGYDSAHLRERTRWAPHVARGEVDCARCGQRIQPGQAWDLGHTEDRRGWSGPEHAVCNRAAGARVANDRRPFAGAAGEDSTKFTRFREGYS